MGSPHVQTPFPDGAGSIVVPASAGLQSPGAHPAGGQSAGGQSSGPPWVEAYTPNAADLVREVVRTPLTLWRSRDILLTCLGRDLAGRFRGTALGWLWPFLQPLVTFGVYGFVFTQLLGIRMPGTGEGQGAAYGLYLLSGALVWSTFAESVARGTTSLVDGRQLMTRLAFPAPVLPLVGVLASGVVLVAGVAAFLVAIAVSGWWPVSLKALPWIPVLLFLQLLLTYGVTLLVSAVHVYLRDTREVVTSLLTVLMFATPVFWVPSPAVVPGIERWMPWIEANPLHQLCYAWRMVLLAGEPTEVFPHTVGTAVMALVPWALGLFFLGRVVFARLQSPLRDEV